MAKVTLSKKGDVLTIEIPVNKQTSKSGKSTLIATTNGNKPTDVKVNGKTLVLSVNAYIPN